MRSGHSRAAAAAAALAAGGLAAYSLRPTHNTTAAIAARDPALEVRTQVIRRTIHIIRHEPRAALRSHRVNGQIAVQTLSRPRTAASASRGLVAASGSTAVATRTSGAHSISGQPVGTSALTTRTSGSHGSSSTSAPAGGPVTTRTSASRGGSSPGSGGRPVTRTSGGKGHGEGDGGDGHGGDN